MAGFQGFTLKDLADMSRLTELTEVVSQHRELIKTRIKAKGSLSYCIGGESFNG
jgi:hypothetical protein